jgi:hypothetical protein
MATTDAIVQRVRLELGDLGKSFVETIVADGTTNRFQLQYNPVTTVGMTIFVNGVDKSSNADSSVEATTGVIVLTATPAAGHLVVVKGTHYRYFTDAEMATIVESAVGEHSAKRTDSLGRPITLASLPSVEEYPVTLYATTMALYTLATDASFDIDISAPDGVMIPRSERYRQLTEMAQMRHQQYREICSLLGIGLYAVEVLPLRRISKTTNRYVPIYKPQEVDDKSFPQRAELSTPTYGDANVPWITEVGPFTAYQDVAFSGTAPTFQGDYAGYTFVARLVIQRGSTQKVQPFTLSITSTTPNKTVTNIARTAGSGTTVLTTSSTHGFTVGNVIRLERFSNDTAVLTPGRYTITAVTSNTFTVVDSKLTTAVTLTSLSYLVEKSGNWTYTSSLSLTRDQTLRLPQRCWWQVVSVNPDTAEEIEIIGGDFFTRKINTSIL